MDHDEAGVAVDMYDFLQQFMQAHPKYSKMDFYAVGESYARIRALRSGFARTLKPRRFCLLACLPARTRLRSLYRYAGEFFAVLPHPQRP